MRTVVKIPRVLKINRVEKLTVSVVFNNGESRIIDFAPLLKDLRVPESISRILSNPREFKKMKLANHTLSWDNTDETITFNGKSKKVPFEIGADILYKYSQPEQAFPVAGLGQQIRK